MTSGAPPGRHAAAAVFLSALLFLLAGCNQADPAPPSPLPAPPADQLRIAVPAYVDPKDSNYWQALIDGAPKVRDVIVNPNSGPGATKSERHVELVGKLQNAGIRVLGYVMTGWGERDPEAVTLEIDRWREWYGVENIFLDEAASKPAEIGTYAGYAAKVHGTGGLAVLNPGIIPDRGYFEFADAVVTFEDPFTAYFTAKEPPEWLGTYTGTEVWHIVSGAPQDRLGDVLNRAREQGAEYIYVTDDEEPNPYDSLPAYWPAKLNSVEE